jgi:hypothetical protein
MRTPQTKRIGEHEYTVTPLGAIRGSQVLVRVLKIVGPLFTSKDLSALQESDMDYMREVFAPLSTVNIEGKEPLLKDVFDAHFVGKYDEMIGWLMFCLEVNFQSILVGKGLGLAVGKASPLTGPKSAETGASGVSSPTRN